MLLKVPTTLIGNKSGILTPTKAIYTTNLGAEVKYERTGDGTITGFSTSLNGDRKIDQ